MRQEILVWPTSEGIWMGNVAKGIGWFPFQVKSNGESLSAQIIGDDWRFVAQALHPVYEWRLPTEEELVLAREFYHLPTEKEKLTKAQEAIDYLMTRIRKEPQLRYQIGFGTEAFRLLTEAAAELSGKTVKQVEDFALGK
jgi:hypothetical protein